MKYKVKRSPAPVRSGDPSSRETGPSRDCAIKPQQWGPVSGATMPNWLEKQNVPGRIQETRGQSHFKNRRRGYEAQEREIFQEKTSRQECSECPVRVTTGRDLCIDWGRSLVTENSF